MIFLSVNACGQSSFNTKTDMPTSNVSDTSVSEYADEETDSDIEIIDLPQSLSKKSLIVYFSWSSSGNTEKIANAIN